MVACFCIPNLQFLTLSYYPYPNYIEIRDVDYCAGARRSLRPSMTPGVYVNFMSGDEDDRVPEAYQQRWERLVAIKSHYDPDNLFRLNQNIRPQKRSAMLGTEV